MTMRPPPRPMSGPTYYTPSGKFGPTGLILMPAIGFGAALVLGFVHGYVTQYNPFIYFNFIGTIILGAGLGMAVSMGARIGKVRAPSLALIMGIVVGLVGLYFAWMAWIHALMGRADAEGWVILPGQLWAAIGIVAQHGAWSIHNLTPTGGTLYFFWAVEAAIIVGLAVVIPFGFVNGTPFCETCDCWAESEFEEFQVGSCTNVETLKKRLEARNLQAITELGAPEPYMYTELGLEICPHCKQVGYLTVESVSVTAQGKGKAKTDKTEVVKNLVLSATHLDKLRELISAPPPAPREPSPPEPEAAS